MENKENIEEKINEKINIKKKVLDEMINGNLKNRGYTKYGFTEHIKNAQEIYPDGTIIEVEYYGKIL